MKIGSVVIHGSDFDAMWWFWAAALGCEPREPPAGDWVILRNPQGRCASHLDCRSRRGSFAMTSRFLGS